MNREQLTKQVKEVFGNVQYPGDEKLTSHECWECDEIKDLFRGKPWQEWEGRPVWELAWRGGAPFSLLSPGAFHYYTPAFLIAALNDKRGEYIPHPLALSFIDEDIKYDAIKTEERQSKSQKLRASLSKATRPDADRREWFTQRMLHFDAVQLNVIRDVFQYVKDNVPKVDLSGDISKAIASVTSLRAKRSGQ